MPSQYDATAPACLYVGLDGVLCNAPAVIDSLIAARKMPVTIGVFLKPGVVMDDQGQVLRYNRSNEFDMPNANFGRFVEDELLPQVEKTLTAKGLPIRLSRRGTDRMIFGLSSGGIAAFTAAWHNPELFGKVFSGVGTFVAMRGGNDLQAVVRKSEPKPIRVFLQDGSNDVWNATFGHWYEGNKMLASALDFAGYDAKYDWSDGGHNVRRSSAIFAQVMEWMWRDWPKEVTPGTTRNDFLAPMLAGSGTWEKLSKPVNSNPPHEVIAFYPDSTLMAWRHDSGSNCLWQAVIQHGTPNYGQPFYWLHNYDNHALEVGAMKFDGKGNLWVATDAGLQVCDQNGRVRCIIDIPRDITARNVVGIAFTTDGVTLVTDKDFDYRRRLNVAVPAAGTRPDSQGEG